VPAGDRDGHGAVEAADLHDDVMDRPDGSGEVRAAAACGAKGAEGDSGERRGGRAVPAGPPDADPGTVGVVGVVEPLAAHLVAGDHVAGELRPGDARDAWRQQALLDLGGGARRPASPGHIDHVGVARRELEGDGGLTGQPHQRLLRRADRE
jgi:hypothetical protein